MSRSLGGDSEIDDIDVWTVDRLLDGSIPDLDVPAGYAEIASLIGVIHGGVSPAPSGWGSRTVPAMAQMITAPPRRHGRKRNLRYARRLSHAAAAVGVFAALGASGAAAATGSLPAPVQSAVHSAAVEVGVPIPDPTSGQPSPPSSFTSGRAPAAKLVLPSASQSQSPPLRPERAAAPTSSPPSQAVGSTPAAQTVGSTVPAGGGTSAAGPSVDAAPSVDAVPPEASTPPSTTATAPGTDSTPPTSVTPTSVAQTPPSTAGAPQGKKSGGRLSHMPGN